MKFRNLRSWDNIDDLEGLAFFAQLLEELLFDYSLDTYKPSAMNTSTLCIESLNIIKEIENGLIDQNNLTHVLNELVVNLKNDLISKSLIDLNISSLCNKLVSEVVTISDKKIILEILNSQLSLNVYISKAKELLSDAVKSPREKNLIRNLTRSYVTSLLNIGYSSRYLYATSRLFFHISKRKINSCDDIKEFFKLVNGENLDYIAIFKAGSLFDTIKESCNNFNIKVCNELDDDFGKYAKSKNFRIESNNRYLVIENLKAKDVFSARSSAEKTIQFVSTLTNLFHHKEIPAWENTALLVNKDSKIARIVTPPKNSMLKCADLRPQDAAEKLNNLITTFNLKPTSIQKFINASSLHFSALKDDTQVNQLLNLWVGLETLVPSFTNVKKAKINKIIDSILPILCLEYIPTLIDRLVLDLKNWNRGAFEHSIKDVSAESEKLKLLHLLLFEENAPKKDELFAKVGNFYLLRNRMHYFTECLSSTKKISIVLANHWERVAWQIRRIYRARNIIVHAGRTPANIDILIKNLHDYLDVTIGGISYLASDFKKMNTLEKVFKFASFTYEDHIQELTNKDVKVTEENIGDFLVHSKYGVYDRTKG